MLDEPGGNLTKDGTASAEPTHLLHDDQVLEGGRRQTVSTRSRGGSPRWSGTRFPSSSSWFPDPQLFGQSSPWTSTLASRATRYRHRVTVVRPSRHAPQPSGTRLQKFRDVPRSTSILDDITLESVSQTANEWEAFHGRTVTRMAERCSSASPWYWWAASLSGRASRRRGLQTRHTCVGDPRRLERQYRQAPGVHRAGEPALRGHG